jgi:hypothetical protein
MILATFCAPDNRLKKNRWVDHVETEQARSLLVGTTKTRHQWLNSLEISRAAALVVVSWYLIAPPIKQQMIGSRPALRIDADAPLADWIISRSFDSESDCKQWLANLLHHESEFSAKPSDGGILFKESHKMFTSMQCVEEPILS